MGSSDWIAAQMHAIETSYRHRSHGNRSGSSSVDAAAQLSRTVGIRRVLSDKIPERPDAVVYIESMDPGIWGRISISQLRNFLESRFGPLHYVTVPKDRGTGDPLGYAWAEFHSERAAMHASNTHPWSGQDILTFDSPVVPLPPDCPPPPTQADTAPTGTGSSALSNAMESHSGTQGTTDAALSGSKFTAKDLSESVSDSCNGTAMHREDRERVGPVVPAADSARISSATGSGSDCASGAMSSTLGRKRPRHSPGIDDQAAKQVREVVDVVILPCVTTTAAAG